MSINDKVSKIWNHYFKHAIEIGIIVAGAAVVGKVIYDREIRDDPEIYKGFPKNFTPKDVTIFKPDHGTVNSDIIYVEMLPDEPYKLFNVNDSTVAYEGKFKYEIRPGSAGIFRVAYGSDIRPGRVEGIRR